MDFTNATHGLGCHSPPGPRTCRHKLPTHLGLSLSPGTLEGHQPQVLAIHPPSKPHTHSKHYCPHPKESLRPPLLKGQYFSFLHTRPSHGNGQNARLHPRSTFYTWRARAAAGPAPHTPPPGRAGQAGASGTQLEGSAVGVCCHGLTEAFLGQSDTVRPCLYPQGFKSW